MLVTCGGDNQIAILRLENSRKVGEKEDSESLVVVEKVQAHKLDVNCV